MTTKTPFETVAAEIATWDIEDIARGLEADLEALKEAQLEFLAGPDVQKAGLDVVTDLAHRVGVNVAKIHANVLTDADVHKFDTKELNTTYEALADSTTGTGRLNRVLLVAHALILKARGGAQ